MKTLNTQRPAKSNDPMDDLDRLIVAVTKNAIDDAKLGMMDAMVFLLSVGGYGSDEGYEYFLRLVKKLYKRGILRGTLQVSDEYIHEELGHKCGKNGRYKGKIKPSDRTRFEDDFKQILEFHLSHG